MRNSANATPDLYYQKRAYCNQVTRGGNPKCWGTIKPYHHLEFEAKCDLQKRMEEIPVLDLAARTHSHYPQRAHLFYGSLGTRSFTEVGRS